MSRSQVQSVFDALARTDTAAPLRILCIYAHPDDEAIAMGGHLPLFRHALFVQVTDGAPADNADGTRLGLSRDSYRTTRALESRAAFAAAGLPEAHHLCLNLSDKEAAFHLAALTGRLRDLIADERPAAIFTHPYEGGHADHDACAFAVHTAVAVLSHATQTHTTAATAPPLIIESPFYFRDPTDGSMHTGTFLQEDESEVLTLLLGPAAASAKRDAFAAFRTQRDVLAHFAQALQQERFRIAPAYDFTRPPTQPAFYESFIPDLTAARFAERAAESLRALQLELLPA